MSYILKPRDFADLHHETISLKILTQDHVTQMMNDRSLDNEYLRILEAGIMTVDIVDQADKQLDRHNIPISKLFLVITNPELIGLINVGYVDISNHHLNSMWWINNIWVAAHQARRGVGFTALQTICKHIKTLNPTEIWANINIANNASVNLFQKAGFEKRLQEERGGALFILK